MSIEYLLVTYPEQRNVFADGIGVVVTNHILMLPGDEYQITLEGAGYAPAGQDVALNGTALVKPLVIAFTPTTADSAAMPGSAPSSPAAPSAAKLGGRSAAVAPDKTLSRSKKNA